jgi:NADH dehydrogenase FAD-containing subunit
MTLKVFQRNAGRGKRMVTDAFNKVNGTKNIYAIGDTAIQNSDAAFLKVIRKWRK